MCRVCVEVQLGKLTVDEAQRNFYEINHEVDPEHYEDFMIILVNEIFPDGTD